MKPTLTDIDLQALEAGLTKGHRLAAATHAAPETIGQIIERLRGLETDHTPDGWPAVRMRDITALIAHIDGHHSEHHLEMVGRWYMVNKDGMATLCTDRADAEKEAVDAQSVWPHMGPHRAVQLIEASFEAADMATAAAQWFRDGVASVAASAGSKPVIGWHAFPHYLQHPDGRHLRTASDLLARHGYTGCAEPLRAMSDVLLPTNPSPPEGMAGWTKLRGQRMVLCSLLGECLPVIDALMQIPGDDDSDARLNGLAGRIMDALDVIAEAQAKGGES